MSTDQGTSLFEPVTAHCFFVGSCAHTETGFDPATVHERMERHYATGHRGQLDSITGQSTETPSRRVGDVLELEIGCAARRKYEVIAVEDDAHFTVQPIARTPRGDRR